MKNPIKHPPFGLRMVKTALAVSLAIVLVRLFDTEPLSVFYAALGALVVMDTTFSRSLKQGLTQLSAIFFGMLFGYLLVLLFPEQIPAWGVGIGLLLLIFLCNRLKLSFTITLSCIVFLSTCLTPGDRILYSALLRLWDTTVGIGIGLLVNGILRPYNNKKRILSLLRQLREQIPQKTYQIVVEERFPDLSECIVLLRRLEQELELYHAQHFFHRKNDDEALLSGCCQLAQRMVEELEAICGMDSLGDLASENEAHLRELGLKLPPEGLPPRKCTRRDTIVMNYHLDKLLTAYTYLGELTAS